MTAKAIKTYLESDIAREVARAARAQGRSESAIVADAVRSRFVQTDDGESVKRQLNRLELRIDKILRDQAIMRECLLLFVRVWLEHNPPLDDDAEESAAASAEARFERFLDLLTGHLAPGQSLVDANGAGPPSHELQDAEARP